MRSQDAETIVVTSIRLPVGLRERFKEVARNEDRSFGAELRRIMERRIAEATAESNQPKAA